MKIIGKGTGEYVVTLREDELANLLGHHNIYAADQHNDLRVGVGVNLRISDMFRHSHAVTEQKANVERARKVLLDTLNTLAEFNPVVPAKEEKP